MTGKDQMAGVSGSPDTDPSYRPAVSHHRDTKVCTHCNKTPRHGKSMWCVKCIAAGRKATVDSIKRQVGAGMQYNENRVKNWEPGDPLWWRASGCYGKD